MPMSLRKGGRRSSPPFSYVIFIIATVEALFWFAPLLESTSSLAAVLTSTSDTVEESATTAANEEAGKIFICTLADYLKRELLNIKSTTQRWKVVGIEEQEEYQQLNQLRNSSYKTDAELFAQQHAELLHSKTDFGVTANSNNMLLIDSHLPLKWDCSTQPLIGSQELQDEDNSNFGATIAPASKQFTYAYSVASEGLALYIRYCASIFVALEVYGRLFGSNRLNTLAVLGCTVLLLLQFVTLPVQALEHGVGATNGNNIEAEVVDNTNDNLSSSPSVEYFKCTGVPSCSNHGACVSDVCVCDFGWHGLDCSSSMYSWVLTTFIQSRAVLLLACSFAGIGYLIMCGWLSVSWLHFAKALVLWHKKQSPLPPLPTTTCASTTSSSISSSTSAAFPAATVTTTTTITVTTTVHTMANVDADGGVGIEINDDEEAQVPSPRPVIRFFDNEQEAQSLLGRIRLIIRECRYKITVVHDALLTFATIFRPSIDLPLFPAPPVASFVHHHHAAKERE